MHYPKENTMDFRSIFMVMVDDDLFSDAFFHSSINGKSVLALNLLNYVVSSL